MDYGDAGQFVREAFDAFFSSLVYIEQAIEIDLTDETHVAFPVGYYVEKLARHRPIYEAFLNGYKYTWVLTLLNRYEAWVKAGSAAAGTAEGQAPT